MAQPGRGKVSFTGRLAELPPPRELYRRGRALAIIELAINHRPFMRWHTLDPEFDSAVRISSGSGDEACVWLTGSGCVVRGFDHESPLSPWVPEERRIWPGLVEGFPEELRNGPGLNLVDGVEDLTFLIWWKGAGPWKTGRLAQEDSSNADIDGSAFLLGALISDEGALAFLSEYYEKDFPSDAVRRFDLAGTIQSRALADLPDLRPLDSIAAELEFLGLDIDSSAV